MQAGKSLDATGCCASLRIRRKCAGLLGHKRNALYKVWPKISPVNSDSSPFWPGAIETAIVHPPSTNQLGRFKRTLFHCLLPWRIRCFHHFHRNLATTTFEISHKSD